MPATSGKKPKKVAQKPKKRVPVAVRTPKKPTRAPAKVLRKPAKPAKPVVKKHGTTNPARSRTKKPRVVHAPLTPSPQQLRAQKRGTPVPPPNLPLQQGGKPGQQPPPRRQALSIQPGAGRRPGAQGEGGEQRVGLDRSRLGAIQGKLFRPQALSFETRQKLALMVSAVAVATGKPRIVKSQVADDLARLSRAVKANVSDAALKADILNDIDAFGAVVKNH